MCCVLIPSERVSSARNTFADNNFRLSDGPTQNGSNSCASQDRMCLISIDDALGSYILKTRKLASVTFVSIASLLLYF